MDGERIEMSQRERDRLKVMSLVLDGKRRQKEGRLSSCGRFACAVNGLRAAAGCD